LENSKKKKYENSDDWLKIKEISIGLTKQFKYLHWNIYKFKIILNLKINNPMNYSLNGSYSFYVEV